MEKDKSYSSILRFFLAGFKLFKFVKLVKLVKLLKILKFTKLLFSLITMLASVLVYSFAFGWKFAVGLVALLFIHEMGHVIAFKIKGYKVSAPIFIPMFGAVIFSPKFENQEDEAFSAYGGPLLGGISALILFVIWRLNPENHLLLLLSYIAVYLNLFNLIPIKPIDGGRITGIIGSWFKYIGIGALLLFTAYIRQPVMLLIWILVLHDLSFLKPNFRLIIGVTCQIIMTILIFSGFSHQGHWVDLMDFILALVFNIFLFVEARKKYTETGEAVILAPRPIRIKWLILYLTLVLSLFFMLVWQLPYLQAIIPKH
jgi:Zn-dependent protease